MKKFLTVILFSLCSSHPLKAQYSVVDYQNYISVRPITFLGLNPNIQFGRLIRQSDGWKPSRLIEYSAMFPYSKTVYKEIGAYKGFGIKMFALQFEAKYRFIFNNNNFVGPMMAFEYFNFENSWTYRTNEPRTNYINLMLGFDHGKYSNMKARSFNSFHWGLALRHTTDFIDPKKLHGFGNWFSHYWGLKMYVNWQFGVCFNAVKLSSLSH